MPPPQFGVLERIGDEGTADIACVRDIGSAMSVPGDFYDAFDEFAEGGGFQEN